MFGREKRQRACFLRVGFYPVGFLSVTFSGSLGPRFRATRQMVDVREPRRLEVQARQLGNLPPLADEVDRRVMHDIRQVALLHGV